MNVIIKQVKLIERVDRLIRLQATGPPDELACKLGVSKTKLYRIINLMKQLDAPIKYDTGIRSFVYKKAVGFTFGFFSQEHERINTAN